MIPYDVDPSLHPAEPAPPTLDDGFAPPQAPAAEAAEAAPAGQPAPVAPVAVQELAAALGDKSDF